ELHIRQVANDILAILVDGQPDAWRDSHHDTNPEKGPGNCHPRAPNEATATRSQASTVRSRQWKREAARRLLEDQLASGRRTWAPLVKAAAMTDISERTLERAAREIGVQIHYQGRLCSRELPAR